MTPSLKDRVIQRLKEVVSPEDGVFGILAAVSGGSDSLGMLLLLWECQQEIPFRLAAGVVDHGLRNGVDKEIALVRGLAEQLGIPMICAEIPKHEAEAAGRKGSIQAWARERRYELLIDMAKEIGACFIATGHTRDDQAETVLLRLLRGTGIDGISGIPRIRELSGNVRVIRPILDIGREEIRADLRASDVLFADDPSNESARFLRVRVRKELLPLMNEMNPGIAARLAALASDAAAVGSFLDREEPWSRFVFQPLRLGSGIRVDRRAFDTLPRALWPRLIRRAIERVQGNLRRLERIHLEPFEEYIVKRKSTGKLPLPDGPSVFVDRGSLLLFPGPLPQKPTGAERPSAEGPGLWKAHFPTLFASAEIRAQDASVTDALEIRTRRPGDRLFGASKRFKEVLIAAKVPRPYRDFVPLLAEGDRVVSCPTLLESRKPGLTVHWVLDEAAPFLDLDFASRP